LECKTAVFQDFSGLKKQFSNFKTFHDPYEPWIIYILILIWENLVKLSLKKLKKKGNFLSALSPVFTQFQGKTRKFQHFLMILFSFQGNDKIPALFQTETIHNTSTFQAAAHPGDVARTSQMEGARDFQIRMQQRSQDNRIARNTINCHWPIERQERQFYFKVEGGEARSWTSLEVPAIG